MVLQKYFLLRFIKVEEKVKQAQKDKKTRFDNNLKVLDYPSKFAISIHTCMLYIYTCFYTIILYILGKKEL